MLSPSDPRVGVLVNPPTWVGLLQTSCSGDLNPIQSLTPPSPPFSLFALLRSRFPRLKVSHAVRLLCSCCCRHSSKPARLTHATMCDQLRRTYVVRKRHAHNVHIRTNRIYQYADYAHVENICAYFGIFNELYFFQRNEITLWGKKCTALFQTHY